MYDLCFIDVCYKSAPESHGNHRCYLHTFTVEDEFHILRPKPPTFIDSKGILQCTVLLKHYLIYYLFSLAEPVQEFDESRLKYGVSFKKVKHVYDAPYVECKLPRDEKFQ